MYDIETVTKILHNFVTKILYIALEFDLCCKLADTITVHQCYNGFKCPLKLNYSKRKRCNTYLFS